MPTNADGASVCRCFTPVQTVSDCAVRSSESVADIKKGFFRLLRRRIALDTIQGIAWWMNEVGQTRNRPKLRDRGWKTGGKFVFYELIGTGEWRRTLA